MFLFIFFFLKDIFFLKNKLLNFIWLNSYNNIFLLKLSSLLNNFKLNLLVLMLLVIIFLKNFFKKINFKFFKKILIIAIFTIFLEDVLFYPNTLGYDYFQKKINLALLNGVVNIHPWFNFIVYGVFLSTLIVNLTKFSKISVYKYFFILSSNKKRYFLLITLAIILGSYWAFQELHWGGWWNWDVVELISLVVFFYIIIFTHTNIKFFFKKNNTRVYILTLLITVTLIIRFNFLNSIHAFINPNSTKIFFLKNIFISTTILSFTYIWGTFYKNIFLKKIFKTYNIPIIFTTIFINLIFVQIIVYLIDTLLNLKNIGSWFFFLDLMFMVLVFFFLCINNNFKKIFLIKYLLIINYTTYICINFFNLIRNNTPTNILHHNLIILFLLSLFYVNICSSIFNTTVEFLSENFSLNSFWKNNIFLRANILSEFLENENSYLFFYPNNLWNISNEFLTTYYKNYIFFFKNFLIKSINLTNMVVYITHNSLLIEITCLFFIIIFIKPYHFLKLQ